MVTRAELAGLRGSRLDAPWGQVRPPGMPYPAPAYSVDAPLVRESCGPLGELGPVVVGTSTPIVGTVALAHLRDKG